MPYLVPDLCEDRSSSIRDCTLTGGADTDVTVLDTIHLTPKVIQPFFGGGVKPIVGKVTIFISFHK